VIRTMLKSKIHRATVTEANVEYEGSVTIDSDLLRAAGSREICVNGAAAHLIKPHDLAIICSYVQVDDAEARTWEARRIFVDEANRIRA